MALYTIDLYLFKHRFIVKLAKGNSTETKAGNRQKKSVTQLIINDYITATTHLNEMIL